MYGIFTIEQQLCFYQTGQREFVPKNRYILSAKKRAPKEPPVFQRTQKSRAPQAGYKVIRKGGQKPLDLPCTIEMFHQLLQKLKSCLRICRIRSLNLSQSALKQFIGQTDEAKQEIQINIDIQLIESFRFKIHGMHTQHLLETP